MVNAFREGVMSNFSRGSRALALALGMLGVAGALSGCAVGVSAGAGAAVTVTDTTNERPHAAITSDPYMAGSAAASADRAADRAVAEASGHPRR